jgi:hypothetical protein
MAPRPMSHRAGLAGQLPTALTQMWTGPVPLSGQRSTVRALRGRVVAFNRGVRGCALRPCEPRAVFCFDCGKLLAGPATRAGRHVGMSTMGVVGEWRVAGLAISRVG